MEINNVFKWRHHESLVTRIESNLLWKKMARGGDLLFIRCVTLVTVVNIMQCGRAGGGVTSTLVCIAQ